MFLAILHLFIVLLRGYAISINCARDHITWSRDRYCSTCARDHITCARGSYYVPTRIPNLTVDGLPRIKEYDAPSESRTYCG
jgi:hypothetical protein